MRGDGAAAAPGRGGIRRLIARLAAAACLLAAPAAVAAQAAPVAAIGDDSLRVVYWPGQRPLAERALRAARAPLPLPGIPRHAVLPSGTIFLAPSPAVFDSLTRGRAPGWSAGVAIPARRIIILPAFVSQRTALGDPITALRHEIVHLALHAYLPDNIPRWFDEGYATWASGGWDEGSGWQIRLALLRGSAPPLDSLRLAWPRGEAQARLAYLLSASAVRHLATRSGEPAFAALLEAWRREGSFDTALRTVYQITPTQLEQEWRRMVRRRYGWMLALSQMGAFWLLLILLLLLLSGPRRRRQRERLRQLELEDRMLPPPDPHGVDYPTEVE